MMSQLGSSDRPARVAIVGAGPSGFYAADRLFKSDQNVKVNLFDRLPSPFGLVRGGVAPDHPKIKSITRVFDKIASNEGFAFWGNVKVGESLSVEELLAHHDAVIFTCGAETDRKLGIPGEDLPGSHTATSFVGWYNGHPDYRDLEFDLSGEVAVVIGQGNVAMDVARILVKTQDELKTTDIAQHALEALAKSNIKEVHMIGRRGPVQAKFTPPEIKEFGQLEDCHPLVRKVDLELNPASQEELDHPKTPHTEKVFSVLTEFAGRDLDAQKSKRYQVHFLKSPVEILGTDRVSGVRLEKNVLKGESHGQWSEGTGETEELSCSLFLRSVGYRGIPMPGVPFDEKKAVFPNAMGRILDGDKTVPGLYTAGWIKRGPSGVIGTNKPDAYETADALLEDLPSLAPCPSPSDDGLRARLKDQGIQVVSYDDWRKIDAAEIERGQAVGKPREKFTRLDDALNALK
jgi:ferredoxin--NADP+ reductase